jgi:hypothetical protein
MVDWRDVVPPLRHLLIELKHCLLWLGHAVRIAAAAPPTHYSSLGRLGDVESRWWAGRVWAIAEVARLV